MFQVLKIKIEHLKSVIQQQKLPFMDLKELYKLLMNKKNNAVFKVQQIAVQLINKMMRINRIQQSYNMILKMNI
jgi:hypothetical protein